MTTYTLLVWEEVPEATRIFAIDNSQIDDELANILQTAHGCYLNMCDNTPEQDKALDYLGNALMPEKYRDEPEMFSDDFPEDKRCSLAKYERPLGKGLPIDESITKVVVAGFIM